MLCPCHSTKQYQACCEPFHIGLKYPESAEVLMRSRYSAYSLHLTDYLKSTWHTSTQPTDFNNLEDVKWLGLKIVTTSCNNEKKEDFVEFIARYKDAQQNGRADKIHEKSRFILENGKLVYIDGIFM